MYPLKVILVGCQEANLTQIQQDLLNQAVQIEGEFPDVKTAVASMTLAKDEKRLFITQLQSATDVAQIERLNETFSGRPILALVDREALNQELVLHAMRAGAAQVVSLPPEFQDFKAAMDRIAKQFGYTSAESKVIAVSGVSEGCGATTVATNLAYEIATVHKAPCILAELTLPMGRLAVYLNLEPRFTTQDLLADMEHLDVSTVKQALIPAGENLSVLSGPYRAITPLAVSGTDVLRLIEYMRRLSNFVVLDMPYTYDETYLRVMGAADQVVLVAEQKLASVHGLVVVRDSLARQERVGTQFLVINRYNSYLKELRVDYLRDLLKVDNLMTIANDTDGVKASTKFGKPLRVQAPHSPALEGIGKLTSRLLGQEVPEHGIGHFFHKVAQAVGLQPA